MEVKDVHMVLNTYHVSTTKLHEAHLVNLSRPADLALSSSAEVILSALLVAPAPMSIRQLARTTRLSHVRAQEVINHFADRGLVLIDQVGRSHLCAFNRKHIAASAIQELLHLQASIRIVIANRIDKWSLKPLSATLFGSAARGTGSASSDIDILLIKPERAERSSATWADQLFETSQHLQLAIGNNISWFDLTQSELLRANRAKEPLIARVKREGVHLLGEKVETMLGRSSNRVRS
jgi:predicted nucleotidyltransferase